MDTYIHHRFMEEMIVPLCALDPNYGIYLGENIERAYFKVRISGVGGYSIPYDRG